MILELNLQFFAKDGPGGEKTEPATEKKLKDARKDGKVAKSRELGNGLGLMSFFLILKIFIAGIGTSLLEIFSYTYTRMDDYVTLIGGDVSSSVFAGLIQEVLIDILTIVLPIFLIGVLVAFLGDIVQVKWNPTGKPLQPKFSKLNPIKGMKKIFSKQALMELLKSIIKIGIVIYIAYTTLRGTLEDFYILYDLELMQAIMWMGETVINLGIRISAVYLVFSLADMAYEKWKFNDEMKMTKQEVKDEYKNAEGDPQVKNKIRRKMMEVSQRRMMQELPKADVIITNPTHLSVALKYDTEVSDAPIVIAKGEDYLAMKIREVAREHNIQIVENKPLARMLYHNVEVGSAIPPELYQAVAEILAMVYHAQGKA